MTPGPYAQLLGITLETEGDSLRARMAFIPDLVGRPDPPRLHGGAIGGLLETIGLATARAALADPQAPVSLRSSSIDFLRSGQPRDSFAEATIVKLGRRVINVTATAWQEDRAKPIAQAHITITVAGG